MIEVAICDCVPAAFMASALATKAISIEILRTS
jgi:hypothetical protein